MRVHSRTFCVNMQRNAYMFLLFLFCAPTELKGASPPGKPIFLRCRSPEKETFSCWWEPGSDGGLLTSHRLYYQREDMQGTYECPDYQSAGENSCFFSKNHTSIWVSYILTVVASNALGNTTSDPREVDVMNIMQPSAPENVTLFVEETKKNPHLHISWKHPPNIDIQSGWVTVFYQLRVKQERSSKWEEYVSGKQSHFIVYGLHPGLVYTVQVRCKLDHGDWSDWSNATYRKIPDYNRKDKHFWILVSAISTLTVGAVCMLIINRNRLKQLLLPPVPGPKIRGVDSQLLKNGRPEDFVSGLILSHSFPPAIPQKDQTEDYLIRFDSNDGSLIDHPNSKRRSLNFPAGFHFHSEITHTESPLNQNETARQRRNDLNNFVESTTSLSGELWFAMETLHLQTKKGPCQNINFGSECHTEASCPDHPAESTIRTAGKGYIAIQENTDVRQMDYSKVTEINSNNILFLQKESGSFNSYLEDSGCTDDRDYSKVKEVSGIHTLFPQKESASVNPYYTKVCRQHTECTNQRQENPQPAGLSRTGVCTELSNSEYVQGNPLPPVT
ncbi:prolactin receptor b [Thalassophryne amazonica]|uniref:prolactin receptor b n=1 Tax=Thalassophryne amazonica TaxID=390379 RepID=UPI0014721F4F|nr:prolactin receptor b [Thalassophryne amazonica]